ncbi:low temperature requirement protein A [Agromyces seonyuensis]|uniref:Low temperature requirement protein A n=1 Tax=Agromyces seonyuensis TaxID=2662446 RepID=A0A6I4NZI6_9MICO|nr:low temperature requirement protein A [Agromyces seonyuensis]MWB97845.1 low temperature requirement protein A [Agromyces seonyuensis]
MATATTHSGARARVRGSAVPTRAADRTTPFEIFFDLVFVFALTRVVALVEANPGAKSLVRALVLLLMLWWAWCAFIWLGNQVRLDRGFVRVGMLVAMAALFVVGLVIPEAWHELPGRIAPAVILAIAFTVVRGCYLVLFALIAWPHRRLRTQILLDVVPQSVSIGLVFIGAGLGGTWQTALWATAFVVDFVGGRSASQYRGWRVGSARHFAERHDLVLIIALGETVLATGARVDLWTSAPAALAVALLGFLTTASLWWAFFGRLSADAAVVLGSSDRARRSALARDAYTLGHFPIVAGVVLVALGSALVLDDVSVAPNAPADAVSVVALAGGAVSFLLGLETFRWVLFRRRRRASIVAAAAVLVAAAASPWIPAWTVAAAIAAIVTVASSLVGRTTPPTAARGQHPLS